MKSIAVVEPDVAKRSLLAECLSAKIAHSSFVFFDSVDDLLNSDQTFSSSVFCEESFKRALSSPDLRNSLHDASVLSCGDSLYYKVFASPFHTAHNLTPADFILSRLMSECGFRRGTLGYTFIKDAVNYCLFLDDPRVKLTGRIYPEIAKARSVRSENIERSIRHAIHSADTSPQTHDAFRRLIGNVRPTNSEVIAALTQKLSEALFRWTDEDPNPTT